MKTFLSPSEIRIAHLLCRGFSPLDVALKLGTSVSHVSHCKRNIKKKFGLERRIDFVKRCLQECLVTEEQAKLEPEDWPLFRYSSMKDAPLTDREVECLKLIAVGNTNLQCAAAMGISVKTVEKFRQACYNKLDIHTTAHLVHYALKNNLVELGGCLPKVEEHITA